MTQSTEPTAYRVDGDGVILYWYLPLNARPERYAVSDRLARFVVAYSMLPLRDVTPYSEEMQANGNDVRRYIAARKAAGVDTTELEAVLAPPRPALTPPQRRQRLRWSAVFVGTFVALIIVPVVLEMSVQPRYFATLPARIHARTPIFSDPLTQPDGKWPVTTTTYFKNGAYHLYQPHSTTYSVEDAHLPIAVMLPIGFGDVAVQVTLTGSYRDAGIVLRADMGATTFLKAGLDDGGYAQLNWCPSPDPAYRDSCQTLGFPFRSEPSQNGGAMARLPAHTLLLISRASTWVYYVDGTLVGSYRDTEGIISQQGRIGLYSKYPDSDVAFTNFAVYPVDATLPWGY
ncbi:MAG: hypothetical protein H0X24_20900 [Ktedonobacterales bacterium]|nr:hypothetical protein [Ktedonobacterales bacterium]